MIISHPYISTHASICIFPPESQIHMIFFRKRSHSWMQPIAKDAKDWPFFWWPQAGHWDPSFFSEQIMQLDATNCKRLAIPLMATGRALGSIGWICHRWKNQHDQQCVTCAKEWVLVWLAMTSMTGRWHHIHWLHMTGHWLAWPIVQDPDAEIGIPHNPPGLTIRTSPRDGPPNDANPVPLG